MSITANSGVFKIMADGFQSFVKRLDELSQIREQRNNMDILQYQKLAVEFVNKKAWAFGDDGSRTPTITEVYEVCLYANTFDWCEYLITIAKGSENYHNRTYEHLRFNQKHQVTLSGLTQAVDRCNEVVSSLGVELAEPTKEEEIERLGKIRQTLWNSIWLANNKQTLEDYNVLVDKIRELQNA